MGGGQGRWHLSGSGGSHAVTAGRAVAALSACLVVLVELERLVSGAVSPSGLSRSLSGVIGPAAVWQRSAWDVWAASPATDVVVRVLVAHLLVDLGFVALYAWLLRRWVRYLRRATGPAPRPDVVPRIVPVAALALVLADVAEDVVLGAATVALRGGSVPGWLTWIQASLTSLKWLAFAVLVAGSWVAARRRLGSGPDVVPPLRRARQAAAAAGRALAYQRLSVLVVVLVGALSIVPGPNIWDQLPDVQRRWVDGSVTDLVHLGLAVAGVAALFGQLFVLGRRRSERARATYRDGAVPSAATPWWLWAAWPVLAVVTVGVLVATGHRDTVDVRPLGLFLGTFALLVGSSLLLRRSRFRPPLVGARATDLPHAVRVRVAGDALATAVLVLAGLGLVRSFTAPLVLRPLDPDPGSLAAAVADGALLGWNRWAFQLVLWTLGLALAVGAPSLTRWVARRVDDASRPAGVELEPGPWPAVRRLLDPGQVGRRAVTGPQRVVSTAVWAFGVLVLLVFAVLPLQVAPAVGVVFTLQAVLGAWVVVVGFAVVRLQESQPLEVFRLLRLRATPVITLLVLVPLLASQRGGDADLHAVRQVAADRPAVTSQPARPDVAEVLGAWVQGSGACDRPGPAPGAPPVRPVLLVAAAGGGIRAATWTADVLDVLGESSCGRVAALLSSGVSGGSVGLALGREADPAAAANDISAPDALSTAIAGLFVGDQLAGTTGVRVPAVGTGGRWLDRAGLMETTWDAQVPGLAQRFDTDPGGIGGALVLNSTAAGPGCRVLLSQVDLGASSVDAAAAALPDDPALGATGTAGQPNCRVSSALPPASLDVQEIYGPCTPDISWATAALLSARFATLTPAGRVPAGERRQADGSVLDCTGPAEQAPLQLVDGGYAEGSGLGTLSDLAPALMTEVRSHNARALGGSGSPVLVPVVVLLANAPRSDLVEQRPPLSSELLVPLAGLAARELQTRDVTWLQRLSGQLAAACPDPAAAVCTAAVGDVHRALTGGVVVVAPQTEPAVDAPLGWTLSVDSRVRLAAAAEVQADPTCADRPRAGGYACLGQLLAVLDP